MKSGGFVREVVLPALVIVAVWAFIMYITFARL
jgi:hypothetical protein